MEKVLYNNDVYWADKNNNKWLVSKFTQIEAERYSRSLINCYECVDCAVCTDCLGCVSCTNSKNCYSCKGCRTCYDCIECQNCKGIRNANSKAYVVG